MAEWVERVQEHGRAWPKSPPLTPEEHQTEIDERKRERDGHYDAAYVALAELLDVPLITRDARLARASGIRCRVEVV